LCGQDQSPTKLVGRCECKSKRHESISYIIFLPPQRSNFSCTFLCAFIFNIVVIFLLSCSFLYHICKWSLYFVAKCSPLATCSPCNWPLLHNNSTNIDFLYVQGEGIATNDPPLHAWLANCCKYRRINNFMCNVC
jgi:hypothetical protein